MKNSLSMRILSGFILGVLMGLLFKESTLFIGTMKPIGALFINLCKMVVIPLVFAAVVVGSAAIGKAKKLGRIGLKTMGYYLLTTALAVTLGLVLANLMDPGQGLVLPAGAEVNGKESVPLLQALSGLISTNPLEALVEGNMLQIIVFAIFLGMAIPQAREKAKSVHQFFIGVAELMYIITNWIMRLAPFGVFALIVPVAASCGVKALSPLLIVIITVYVACLLHMAIVYSLAVKTIAGISPWHFFKGFAPAMLVAFSTCSSIAALPISLRMIEERLRVSKEAASFALPLGAAINMNGTAIYHGVCAIFVAQVFGQELTFSQQLTVILTATLASVATAGVPGAGLITLTMVLQSVGLPLEGIALMAGIDRILDMIRTLVNVTGNASAAVILETEESQRVQETKGISIRNSLDS